MQDRKIPHHNRLYSQAAIEPAWPDEASLEEAEPPRDVDDHFGRSRLGRREKIKYEIEKLEAWLKAQGVRRSDFCYNGRLWKLWRENFNYDLSGPTEVEPSLMAFVALDQKVHPWTKQENIPQLTIRHNPVCSGWEETIKEIGLRRDEDLLAEWVPLEEANGQSIWTDMLFYLLDHRRRRALQFLRITGSNPSRDPLFLMTALEHLARTFRHSDSALFKMRRREFVETFYSIFETHLAQHPSICTQDLLWNLARLAPPTYLREIWDLLEGHKVFFERHTYLHWAKAFALQNDFRSALDVLKRCLPESNGDKRSLGDRHNIVNGELFSKSCATILRHCVTDKKNYSMVPGVVAEMVDMGFQPGLTLNNIIIYHAMQANDYRTAFLLYDRMAQDGIEPDKYTYSTMLWGCARSSEPEAFNDFAEHCRHKAHELQSPVLAANYLYFIFQRERYDRNHLRGIGKLLLDTYTEFFKFDPLSQVVPGLVRSPRIKSENMEPVPMALFLVLFAAIRAFSQLSNSRLVTLYDVFRNATRNLDAHPALQSLAQTTHAYNAFIKAFCDKRQFASASEIIREMTDNTDDRIPKPGVIAWTIFMRAFFQDGQVAAGKRVFQIMRQRGVEPDQVTWKILLSEFAEKQLVEDIGMVMENIDEETELDEGLLAKLARVHDQRRLDKEMERAKGVRREKLTKAIEGVGEEDGLDDEDGTEEHGFGLQKKTPRFRFVVPRQGR